MYSQKNGLAAFTQRRSISWFVFVSLLTAALFPSAFSPSLANASGPSSNRLLNYQLRLTDPSGIPVADGTKNIKISFYAASTGGTPVATDCGTTGTPVGRKVIFTNGVGSVLIGETAADASHNCTDGSAPNAISATLFDSAALFIGITVESDAEMTPRKRVVATGYSLNADKLDDLETSAVGGANAFVPVTDSSGNLSLTQNVTVDATTFFVDATNNMVGVGTVTPGAALHVRSASPTFRIEDSAGLGTLLDITSTSGTGVTFRRQGSTDPMIWTMGSSERMRLTDGGNLGIGDATPAAMLTVGGGDAFQVDASGNMIMSGEMTVNGSTNTIGNAATDTLALNAELVTHILPDVDDTFDLGSNVQRWRDLYLGPATLHIGTATGDEAALAYNTTTNLLSIDSTGAVDINGGSGSTGCSVDASGNFVCSGTVSGGSGAAFVNGGNSFSGAATLGTNDNFALALETNNVTRMTLDTDGEVGIGTGVPSATLHVVSAAISNEAMRLHGDSITTGRLMRMSADALTTGRGIELISSSSNATLADLQFLQFNPSFTVAETKTVSGRVANLLRGATVNNASANISMSGAVLRLEDNATLTSGTLTHDANVLELTQFYSANSGSALNVSTAGTGFVLRANDDGTLSDGTPFVIDDNGFVGIGTASPNEQLELTGNFRMPSTTATTGIIFAGTNRFLHAFGSTTNFFAGTNAGNLTLSSSDNVGIGSAALSSLTSAQGNVAVGSGALDAVTSGNGNVGVGTSALGAISTGTQNTAVGHVALADSTDSNNTAVGWASQRFFNGGIANTSLGTESMFGTGLQSTGDLNTALGYRAGFGLTAGSANVLAGYQAGDTLTTGDYNVLIGYNSDVSSAGLTNAVAIGKNALVGASDSLVLGGTGADAVKVGIGTATPATPLDISFANAATGLSDPSSVLRMTNTDNTVNNVAGISFGDANANGLAGMSAVFTNHTGGQLGADLAFYAAVDSTISRKMTLSGDGDLGVGVNLTSASKLSRLTVKQATDETDIGGTTTANASTTITGTGTKFLTDLGLGDRISLSSAAATYATVMAIASDTSLTVDAALGNGTSQTINAKHSIFRLDSGSSLVKAVVNDLGSLGIGMTNPNNAIQVSGLINFDDARLSTFLGKNAGANNTGLTNTGVGYEAMNLGSGAGNANTALGYAALSSVTGADNVGIGSAALFNLTSGARNIGIGSDALITNSTASDNIAIGYRAARFTTGSSNIVIGREALQTNTTGNNNVGIGHNALFNVDAGNNTALGHNAGDTITTGSSNTLIGASADVSSGTLFNATAIGANASVGCSDCLVLGNGAFVGIGIASPANPLSVMNAVTNGPSPIKAKFVTGGTGGHQLVQTLLTDSIGDMVDGFGPFIEFKIEDTANVENQIGLIGFTRDGDDGNGKFRVYPNNGGAPRTDAFAVAYGDANGPLVGVGTATPDTLFNVRASDISLQTEPLVHINNPSTGDSALQFSIVGDAYAMGIDNSDADKFKISYSSTAGAALLGTNDRFVIDDTGRVGLGVTSGAIDGRLDVRGLGSDDLFNLYDTVAQNVLTVLSSGNVGIGDADPASLLTVGSGDLFNVNTLGDVTSNFTTLNGSSTASGSGSGSTTLILTSATNFNIGNYVKVDSTDCVSGVNTCYAKITNIATNTLTISPALTWADTSPVTEVHVPEIGGVDLTQALANRYGRGYFIDGIVVGNGTTYITDSSISSSGPFAITPGAGQSVTINGSLTQTPANLTANGQSGALLNVTIAGSGASSTYYGSKLAITNNQTSNADTVYGNHISFTDSGSLANTVTGLFVDATTVNTADTTYAAIFQGGNVGVGLTSPASKLAVKAASSVSSVTFTGTGVNNMILDTSAFDGTTGKSYRVQMDGAQTFKWSDDGGSTFRQTGITIQTYLGYSLDDGLTITFATTSGHVIGDRWDFSTTVTNPFLVQNGNAGTVMIARNDGRIGIGTSSPVAPLHVTNKAKIQPVAEINTPGACNPYKYDIEGNYAYINDLCSNLFIYDISDPESVSLVTNFGLSDSNDIAIEGDYVYSEDNGTGYDNYYLKVTDVSNPASPTTVSTFHTGQFSVRDQLIVKGGYLYNTGQELANQGAGFHLVIYDVTDPTSIKRVGNAVISTTTINKLVLRGNFMYMVDGISLKVIDVSDPTNPSVVGTVAQVANDVDVQGNYAYLSNSSGSVHVYDVSNPASPTSVGSISGLYDPEAIAVNGHRAYVNEYDRFTIIDVSTPTAPTLVQTVYINDVDSLTEQIMVKGRYLFLTDYGAAKFLIYDIGSSFIQQLEAGGIEADQLDVRSGITTALGTFTGGVTVGDTLGVTGDFRLAGNGHVSGNFGIGTKVPQQDLTLGTASLFVHEMPAPTVTSITSTGGGSLSFGYYSFVVTAIDAFGGESAASTNGTYCSPSSSCLITWNPVLGAASYRVYRGKGNYGNASENKALYDRYKTTSSTSFTWSTDTGATMQAPPTAVTSYVNRLSPSGDSWIMGGNVGIGTRVPNALFHTAKSSVSTTAAAELASLFDFTDTGIVTTGTDLTNGLDINLTRTGATGGTITSTGLDIDVTADTGGTSTAIGLDVSVAGADTNYAALFTGGNVGIGTSTPNNKLQVAGLITFDDSTFSTLLGSGAGNSGPGSWNTLVGYRAGYTLGSGGGDNTALGYQALYSETSGDYNTALGEGALYTQNGGFSNTAVGFNALYSSTTAADNVAIGRETLLSVNSGYGNVAVGPWAGSGVTNGFRNIFMGVDAGDTITTGSLNTIIGYNADATANNLTNAAAIGANASVTCSNCMVLGSGANVGIGTSTPNSGSRLHLASTDSTTAANQTEGLRSIISQTGALSAGNDYSYGVYATSADSGAHTGGAQYIAGLYATASDDNVGGTSDVSGLFTSAGGSGANSVWGVQAYASPGAANSTTASLFGYTNSALPTASTSGAVYGVYSYNAATYTGTTTTVPNRSVYALNQGDWTGLSYGIHVANNNTNTTIDGTSKYGLYIDSSGSYTGSGGAATNNYGLYVATPSGGDNNYGAIFAGGNVGIGDTSPASLLTVGSGDLFNVNSLGDVTSNFTTLNGSTTANGSGSGSTTLILTSAGNFDIGNYVKVDSTDCVSGVNTCYAKITNIATNTLTISPAISWANASTVTEVHVPEIGGTNLAQPLANRYGRGYFIDGIVVGNGTTYFTDSGIFDSSGDTLLALDPGGDVSFVGNVGIGTTSPTGKLHIAQDTGEASGLVIDGIGTQNPNFIFAEAGTSKWNFGYDFTGNYFKIAESSVADRIVVQDSTGNVGIGDTSPASLLTVGNGDLFQVNSSGNIVKINNITYSWPATQGGASSVLTNNGSGTLTWGAASASGWTDAGTTVNLTTSTDSVGIGTTGSSSYALYVVDDTATNAIRGQMTPTSGAHQAIYGLITSTCTGCTSTGAYGEANGATSGYNYGVFGVGSGGSSNNVGVGANGTTYDFWAIGSKKFAVSGAVPSFAGGTAAYWSSTSSGYLGTTTSSIQFKENVQDIDIDESIFYQLRPRTFDFISNGQPGYGMIAEEVEPLIPGLVVYDENGDAFGLHYEATGVYIIDALQKLRGKSLAVTSSGTTVLTTPAAPTVATQGEAGSTTWEYKITARSAAGETLASVAGTVASGNATLNATNFNRITWTAVPNAVGYNVYRTTSGGTPSSTGLIGSTRGPLTFDDIGMSAAGAIPTTDTSGQFGIGTQGLATASETAINSFDLFFRGSAWDSGASAAVSRDLTLSNDVTDKDTYKLSLKDDAGTEVAYFGQDGDLAIKGKLYPSDSGAIQTDKYIYYDGTGDLMRTNAAGWGTGSYDFAEMYPSDDPLEAGDLVMIDVTQDARVKHAVKDDGVNFLLAGIVSTRPGFLAGMSEVGHYPIALQGRVPTKVSAENGAIGIGDPITVSLVPGVGMRATEPGYVVGIALQAFDSIETGSITVMIKPGWFNGSTVASANTSTSGSDTDGPVSSVVDFSGQALIGIGALEGAGAAWSIDATGKLVIRNVETDAVTIKQTDTIATLDRATLPAGETYTQVHNDAITPDSRVFVTFRKNPGGAWWIDEVGEGFFVLKSAQAPSEDAVFDYWLIGVSDERTPPTLPPIPEPAPEPEPVPASEEAGTDVEDSGAQTVDNSLPEGETTAPEEPTEPPLEEVSTEPAPENP